MKNQITFLILFIVLGFGNLEAQVTQEWVARYSGFANSLAIDNSGNVYVTGSCYGSGTDEDYATIKYSSSGEQLWAQRYNGAANSKDCASSILVDGLGNVYVTGWSYVAGGPHFATIKYSSAGEQKWIQIYKELTPSWNRGILPSLAVDGLGNVYVTGSSVGIGNNLDYATIKYDSSGVQQWVQKYDMNTHDESKSIAVDDSGNVYVTGRSGGSGSGFDYATIKYSSSGDSLWVARYNGPSSNADGASSLVVDDLGNVYVTGSSYGNGSDFATIKYNSSGELIWVQRYDEPGYNDFAYKIAVDGSGNVYVTGYSTIGFGYDYATVKYNSSGIQQWVQRYVGPINLGVVEGEVEISIAVDTSGNSYVTGSSYVSGTNHVHDYATIKYNSSGDQQWVQRYNGTGTGWDGAHSIAVDNSENVYVTGYSNGSGGLYYATIKYSQLTGISQTYSSIPEKFSLSQNYPNPFNPNTIINYQCSMFNFVSLKVYDVLGNEVATLVNERQNAGTYEVDFDGSNFSSGVYFYKLTVDGNVIDTKRMMLLK